MNKHLILARYIPATNFRPSRISLQSGRCTTDKRVISYDYGDSNFSNISDIAERWLTDHGYSVHCTCETPNGTGLLINEFVPKLRDAKEVKKLTPVVH